MTVTMTRTVAGRHGLLEAGNDYDLPETVEASYVDHGIAVFKMDEPVVVLAPEPETAEAAPAPENAAKRTRKPRKRKK